MSEIAIDQNDFSNGQKAWEKAMTKVADITKSGNMTLAANGSEAEFLVNYIEAVKEVKEVLQAYNNLLKKDYDCLVAVQKDMELVDQAASNALTNK